MQIYLNNHKKKLYKGNMMIALGLLTIYNIRRQSRYNSTIVKGFRNRRSEGQLTRMLLLQVGVHLIYSLPFGIIYIMNIDVKLARRRATTTDLDELGIPSVTICRGGICVRVLYRCS